MKTEIRPKEYAKARETAAIHNKIVVVWHIGHRIYYAIGVYDDVSELRGLLAIVQP